jgi:hypothetical protein
VRTWAVELPAGPPGAACCAAGSSAAHVRAVRWDAQFDSYIEGKDAKGQGGAKLPEPGSQVQPLTYSH